jgi:outer membrane lipopolysaccharide assembly protein LptE/RlpB
MRKDTSADPRGPRTASPPGSSGGNGRRGLERLRLFVAAGLVVSAAAGCGYRLRGTGSSLPPGIKTISVPVFRNMTTRYELDVKLTRAVIDEFVARGRVRIAGDPAAADAVLEGVITSFSATPIGFSGQGQADRYNITVSASVTLKTPAGEKPVFSNPSFVYNQEYTVPVGRDFESIQTEALDKIAGRFARSLVVSILEGF